MSNTEAKKADDKVETDDKALRREAYSKATSRLREENRDKFNALVQEEMSARGIEWKPRPTEVEKAEAQMRDLLAAHPELAEKFNG